MRFTIIILISVLAIGSSIISFGLLINEEQNSPVIISPYEKLENYKKELEKINQYNQKVLDELEQKITDSENVELEQLREEIKILKQVISDNKAELEEILQKLSEMKPDS